MKLNPYVNFAGGSCRDAQALYERVFGARRGMAMTYGESPMAGDFPAEQHGWIMHSELTIGDTLVMMCDAPPNMYQQPQGISLTLQFDDVAEGDRVFRELAEGGTVTMPFEETFWAERFGMCVDRYGTPWMISAGEPKM